MDNRFITHTLLPWTVALLFLLAGFCLYGSAGHDDSHITFWASYTLVEFGEILNYNGDRIEQSSSLLLTLLTAFVALITRSDVVTAGYLVTSLSGAVAIVLTWQLAKRWGSNPLPAVILLATSPAFMLWNTSGMESTLAAACVLWFVLCWGDLLSEKKWGGIKSLWATALATLCLVSVRPEMMTLLAALAFGLFLLRRISGWQAKLPLLSFYLTAVFSLYAVATYRFFYFNALMPLPVSSKAASIDFEKIKSGALYLLQYGFANSIFLLGSVFSLLCFFRLLKKARDGEKINFHLMLSTLVLLLYLAFIILTGGDWMQSGRFLVPVLPLAAILALHSLYHKKYLFIAVCLIILLLNGKGHYDTLKTQSHGIPIWASYHISPEHQQRYSVFEQYNQEHLRDMDVIDTLDRTINTLLTTHAPSVNLISGQSGMVFFYTAKKYFKQVHFYDTRGLVEDSLLKCPVTNNVKRVSQGLNFDLNGFFYSQHGLLTKCGIPKPDIIYDINDMTRNLPQRMAAQGYTLIHKDGGKMVRAESALPTNTLPAANFAMIANDLAGLLETREPVLNKFHEKPLIKR